MLTFPIKRFIMTSRSKTVWLRGAGMKKGYVIGIDAGGTKVAYGLFDEQGKIIDRMQHPTDTDADGPAFSDTIIANIRVLLERNKLTFAQVTGVGVCMPSFFLYEEGRVLMTSAMTKIKDFPMREYLSERLPTRVALDNDGNAAALAEHRHGAGRGAQHMVYIAIGTGLGSGIIIDGKLFHGSYGWAGECGHMLATPGSGVLCGCENPGCYMSYTSGKFFRDHVKLGLESGLPSTLTPDRADGHHLIEACKKGDLLACQILGQLGHYLAVCVYNIYQMLNINTFVFGGGLVDFGDTLLGPVREEFDRYNKIPLPVYFKTAELKKDFGIIGAAEFIREAGKE